MGLSSLKRYGRGEERREAGLGTESTRIVYLELCEKRRLGMEGWTARWTH